MKIVLMASLVAGGVAVLIGLTSYMVGRRLPAEHVAQGSILVNADIGQVADRIRRVDLQPQWRSQLSSVTIESQTKGVTRYQEHSGKDRVALALYERDEGRSFESQITDPNLPFGGRWLIELSPEASRATLVRVREEGVVRAPVYRALSKYVFGHDTTLKKYLADLAASFQSRTD